MRLALLCALTAFLSAICMAETLHPTSLETRKSPSDESDSEHAIPKFYSLYNDVYDQFAERYSPRQMKRDALEDNLQGLLSSLQSSGIILDVLHEIANSTDEMNTLSSYIFQTLLSISSNTAIAGLNVTVNATDILDQVLDSGIIMSTLQDLFFDVPQRELFSDNLGEVLVNNTWISQVVVNIGETGKLSWLTIFELARTAKSKDPLFQGASYSKHRNLKRDSSNLNNYSGSLLSFFKNIAGSVLGSDLVGSSFQTVLQAVKGSKIIVPTVQEVLSDQAIQNMVGFIANKLYNYGVFDQIPINDLFQKAKKSGVLSDSIQTAFTNDMGSYVIGNIFLRLETKGVFKQMQRNLYGSS